MLFCEGPTHPGRGSAAASSVEARRRSRTATAAERAVGATSASLPSAGVGVPRAIGAEAVSSLKELVRAETERVERELIQRALDETGGNVTQAARKLKICRKSLQTKMKELGLRDKE